MLKKDPELMSEMKVAELRALLLQENTRLIRDSIQALSKETYRALSLEKKTVQTLAERAVEQTLTSESFLKSLKPSAP